MKEKVSESSINIDDYSDTFSDAKFWNKITKLPGHASCAVLKSAITLYVLLTEADVPIWVKTSVIGALGYLISPIDFIPDFLPGGFVDDLAVMTLLLGQLHAFINEDIRARVNDLLPKYCRRLPVIEPTE